MKQSFVLIVLAILLLVPAEALALSDHIEYNINVSNDGSASWKIIQATDITSTVDSCEAYEQKILSIVNSAKGRTGRDMEVDMTSLQMKTEIHWESLSQTIEYVFRWENFSTVKDSQISFGDVFSDNFFSAFYGDGELSVTYPQEYSISAISLLPNEQTNSPQTLTWYRTQDFLSQKPRIVLANQGVISDAGLTLTAIVALCGGTISAIAVGFFLYNRMRSRGKNLSEVVAASQWQEGEDSKQKILKLLNLSGGNIKQSDICTKLRFSRTKTSLLLAEMEKNNQVRRTKKGKTKIVYIESGAAKK
jgi:uncharacterized membrane protein